MTTTRIQIPTIVLSPDGHSLAPELTEFIDSLVWAQLAFEVAVVRDAFDVGAMLDRHPVGVFVLPRTPTLDKTLRGDIVHTFAALSSETQVLRVGTPTTDALAPILSEQARIAQTLRLAVRREERSGPIGQSALEVDAEEVRVAVSSSGDERRKSGGDSGRHMGRWGAALAGALVLGLYVGGAGDGLLASSTELESARSPAEHSTNKRLASGRVAHPQGLESRREVVLPLGIRATLNAARRGTAVDRWVTDVHSTDSQEGLATAEDTPMPPMPGPALPPNETSERAQDIAGDEGGSCRNRRTRVRRAQQRGEWRVVLSGLGGGRCWPTREEYEVLKTRALLQLRRYDACAQTGSGSRDPRAAEMAERCRGLTS